MGGHLQIWQTQQTMVVIPAVNTNSITCTQTRNMDVDIRQPACKQLSKIDLFNAHGCLSFVLHNQLSEPYVSKCTLCEGIQTKHDWINLLGTTGIDSSCKGDLYFRWIIYLLDIYNPIRVVEYRTCRSMVSEMLEKSADTPSVWITRTRSKAHRVHSLR